MFSQLVSANPKGANTKGANTTGTNPIGVSHIAVSPLLVPQGQVRIYLGAAHRFIWPVHLAGWLELGWTTEPGVTPRATPGVTPPATPGVTAVATAPVKPKKRKTPTEPNPTNESSVGANPIGVSPIDGSPLGVGSAKEVDPLPVLVTDFLVDPSVPTND